MTTDNQSKPDIFGPRIKGAVVVKPIIYGNVARFLGQKRDNNHTHEWKVFLRLYNQDDSSQYIKKVQFKLHETYKEPVRVCEVPPYEVNETGWGEFEVVIKIYFADPSERPVTIYHPLKLFRFNELGQQCSQEFISSELYDELIFSEPSEKMYHYLTTCRKLIDDNDSEIVTDFEELRQTTLETIMSAKKKISSEIEDLKRRIESAKDDISKYKDEISKKQKQQRNQPPQPKSDQEMLAVQ